MFTTRSTRLCHAGRLALLSVVLVVVACYKATPVQMVGSSYQRTVRPKEIETAKTFSIADRQQYSDPRDSTLLCSSVAIDESGTQQPCIPCSQPQANAEPGAALSNARALWAMRGAAPYDNAVKTGFIACIWQSYQQAVTTSPEDPLVEAEFAAIRLLSTNASTRAAALSEIDHAIDTLIAAGKNDIAVRILTQTADIVWITAQHMLERPANVKVFEVERNAHDLARDLPPFKQLTPVPAASVRLGVSEAHWVAALYAQAFRLSSANPALQTTLARNTLMPFVTLRDWDGVDSIARMFRGLPPADSVTRIAIALTAYKRSRYSAREQQAVMSSFDSALVHMSRVDSLRYDSFDGILGSADDAWRYRHAASELQQLDTRSWALVDPLWSTPVNEVRLAHRARTAEADLLYGRDAAPGQSGSGTPAGIMLLERGAPDERWRLIPTSILRQQENGFPANGPSLVRGWPGFMHGTELAGGKVESADELYGDYLLAQSAARYEHSTAFMRRYVCNRVAQIKSFAGCAGWSGATWNDVPYSSALDTIDVTLARFRAEQNRTDMYIAARIPLRRIAVRSSGKAPSPDSVRVALWVAALSGATIQHVEEKRARPTRDELDWKTQYRVSVEANSVMHRVELVDDAALRGARGGAVFTADGSAAIAAHGFGASDVLIASSITPTTSVTNSWRDYDIEPNGASVAPLARFAMLWETYELTPDSLGRMRWRVTIRTEKGRRLAPTVRATIAAGTGSATQVERNDPDAAEFSYTREAQAKPVVVDAISYGLNDAPAGRHVVQVRIDDLVSGKSVTRTVSVRVLDPAVQRRSGAR